jgi:hypothetical protein
MSFRYPIGAAAAALVAIGVAGNPSYAIINHNALNPNALNGNAINYNAINHNVLTSNALGHNVVNANALNPNALTPVGSALDDLNGVAVEAVTRPER